jgi:hypothetical protein
MEHIQRMGDDQAGFSVAVDAPTATVRVRVWGFMSAEVADAFGTMVRDACRASPRPSALVIDMTGAKPMRDEGQRSFGALMDALPSLHMASITVVVTSQLVKLQLLRIANQSAARGSLRFV